MLNTEKNFSKVVQVGNLLLKFVAQQEIIQQLIARGKRRLEAQEIEAKLYNDGDIGFNKLVPGSTFGDFSEAKGKTHKKQCVMVMSENFKCLTIRNSELKALFRKSLSAENMALIRGCIPREVLSKFVIKKTARCFTEKTYPAGIFIFKAGQPLRSIFILKSGTCEVYSDDNPLQQGPKDKDQFFLKMPVTGEDICLGLYQGSMSKAFNYYPIKTVGPGQWIGDETYFEEDAICKFSVKTTCPVTLLEIGIEDFATKMPPEKMEELREVSVTKKLLRLLRIKQIASTAQDVKTSEALHQFHQQSLTALVNLHPHASKKIMNSLSNQYQLEGHIRTARYKDAINVGEIREHQGPPNRDPSGKMDQTQTSFISMGPAGGDK